MKKMQSNSKGKFALVDIKTYDKAIKIKMVDNDMGIDKFIAITIQNRSTYLKV